MTESDLARVFAAVAHLRADADEIARRLRELMIDARAETHGALSRLEAVLRDLVNGIDNTRTAQ